MTFVLKESLLVIWGFYHSGTIAEIRAQLDSEGGNDPGGFN